MASRRRKRGKGRDPLEMGRSEALEATLRAYKRKKTRGSEIFGECLDEGCGGVIISQDGEREAVCSQCKGVYEMMSGVN